MLAQNATAAVVPTSVLATTIKATSLFAAGQEVATGAISTQVDALTEGVLKSMLLNKLKVTVAVMLALGALAIGASALPRGAVAAEPASTPARHGPDDGNLKETILALEKRLWEAHTTQDAKTFKNLMADDFEGTDGSGKVYTKKDVLGWVASFRVIDPEMKNTRVVLLNATSAIVTYELRYRVASPGRQEPVTALPAQSTSGWALRDGNWWVVYSETSFLDRDGTRSKAKADSDMNSMRRKWKVSIADQDGPFRQMPEPLSLQLEKINREKKP
jgi:hypothetical protein